ncbi:prepilin-type N-terminal cleavage/methylation domain-containing protein [Gluconacetobacter tumulisoli]|uniref:Prepilin-type N-terminal cleavage/methylation domain-containing protein n=1 Tax=Gluconacetobacter tumulisoli TaxID=1286189 RepID=A0A7W4K6T5_9PROT|nr:prepilin-type N-terminal cleavage/methylation domain-containing protein [Gluconacetobacter tumulisoli]MBB2201449.1 prepilin-type N-terminal cleavage/methylation domain-containing protein [Gluconacetobacter tumulisoli]
MRAVREGGFTLLEMLVVTLLLAMLSLLLSGGLVLGFKGWARQERDADRRAASMETAADLRRLLEAAQDGDGVPGGEFAGTEDRVSFSTLTRLADRQMHRIHVGLGIDRFHRLVMRWQIRPDVECGSSLPVHEDVLMSSIASLNMRYWQSGKGWTRNWQGDGVPDLVGLALARQDGERMAEILVHPVTGSSERD